MSLENANSTHFRPPSPMQAQALFSFLKQTNVIGSFNELFQTVAQFIQAEIRASEVIVIDNDVICYSTHQDFAVSTSINLDQNKEDKSQILMPLDTPQRKFYLLIQRQEQDNDTNSFLECLQEMMMAAIHRLEKLESEKTVKTILNSFQDIYFQTDIKGKLTLITPSVKEVLGYETHELLTEYVNLFSLSSERLENLIFVIKERKKIRNYELTLRTKTGQFKTLLCNFALRQNEKKEIIGIEGIAREITELKQLNEATQKAKQEIERILNGKKQFLANMGHEIRTPMNGIIGTIELLKTTSLNQEQQEYIESLEKSSNLLLHILHNLVDLSQIEANKIFLKPEVFEVKNLFVQIEALFAEQIAQKGNQLRMTISENVPPRIIADKHRLSQIFYNLITNANKFTSRGEVHISLSVITEKDNKLLLQGEVNDTGIGISEENQVFLFDSFSTLQHTYQKNFSGTGLGLNIVKELVALMGGSVDVWSKKGEGSTFRFSFEALKSINTQTTSSSDADQKQIVDVSSKDEYDPTWENMFDKSLHVLVVDDNPINLNVAQKMLEKAGCTVGTATNGKEAIEKIKNNSFEVVFMDIQMPEMDGVTATSFIKRLRITVPPIIALTAFTVAEEKERFINAGMDDYLAKPITPQKLISKVKKWVDKRFLNTNQPTINSTMEQTTTQPKNIKTNTLSIVNTQTAQQLQKWGGRELVEESYVLFEEETTGLIQELQTAFATHDRITIKSHVHTLKGSAGTLGIDRMASFAIHIDTLLKQDLNSDIDVLFHNFVEAFEEYKLNYRIILNL